MSDNVQVKTDREAKVSYDYGDDVKSGAERGNRLNLDPKEYKPDAKVQMEVKDPKTGRKTYQSFIIRGEPRWNTSTRLPFWEYQLDYVKDKIRQPYKDKAWFREADLDRD